MKKTILLLGAVGVLMMTGCADEGITTDYGEWVATSEYSMDGTTEKQHQKKKRREVQII